MKLSVEYISYQLQFAKPATTSRGVYSEKKVWYVLFRDLQNPGVFGIGECAPLKDLSIEAGADFEKHLAFFCQEINAGTNMQDLDLKMFPSIAFGFETALLDLQHGGTRTLFDTDFVSGKEGIPINGLVWMDTQEAMLKQAEEKIKEGFKCIKFKIGALDFDEECRMLERIRKSYNAYQLEIRLDANGAFLADTALEQLKELSRFQLHSIEQPIKARQLDSMQELCAKSPVPIALDEELIGVFEADKLLKSIRPTYIILKPTLIGGIRASEYWRKSAENFNIGWWITSALESNVGLNAIAQYASSLRLTIPQGLGTGLLYTNNIPSPLSMESGYLYYNKEKKWKLGYLDSTLNEG